MSAVVKDKATAFKYELVGSTSNKIVCKASSREIAGPKKKHVDCKQLNVTPFQDGSSVDATLVVEGVCTKYIYTVQITAECSIIFIHHFISGCMHLTLSLLPPSPPLLSSLSPADLIQLTNDPNCQIPILVDMVSARLHNTSWVIVFKALILTHNLMTLGNEVQAPTITHQLFRIQVYMSILSKANFVVCLQPK